MALGDRDLAAGVYLRARHAPANDRAQHSDANFISFSFPSLSVFSLDAN